MISARDTNLCQDTVNRRDSYFNLQLLPQCGSTYNCLSRSLPEIHLACSCRVQEPRKHNDTSTRFPGQRRQDPRETRRSANMSLENETDMGNAFWGKIRDSQCTRETRKQFCDTLSPPPPPPPPSTPHSPFPPPLFSLHLHARNMKLFEDFCVYSTPRSLQKFAFAFFFVPS